MDALISEIMNYRSLSIVGMEKNTGKTECLNYVLRNLPEDVTVAVTSIGTDGERKDIVTATRKPEIALRPGVYFATTEKYYPRKRVLAEVLDVNDEYSAVGRIVTARTLSAGKVMLSGPSTTAGMRRWIGSLEQFDIDLTIIDGALSRLSSASPAISEAMVLSTGAALSGDMAAMVRATAYVVELVDLPLADTSIANKVTGLNEGLWAISGEGGLRELGAKSAFSYEGIEGDLLAQSTAVYVSGALTDKFLGMLADVTKAEGLEVVVRDFTKIFAGQRTFRRFQGRGGRLSVLARSRLIAVTVNPVAPNGLRMDSDKLVEAMSLAVDVPVYDIMKKIR